MFLGATTKCPPEVSSVLGVDLNDEHGGLS